MYDAQSRLVGKVDELGITTSSFEYDAAGNARLSKRAGDVNLVTVDRGPVAPDGSVALTVTDRGVTSTMNYGLAADRLVMMSQTNPAGAGCSAATLSRGYDANANPIREDSFGGNRSCRSYDPARNLKAVEVEGLDQAADCSAVVSSGASLPVGATKYTYEWHPDFPTATRIASPKVISTLVYNGQPDPTNGGTIASCAPAGATLPDGNPIAVLCKAQDVATLDESGASGFASATDSSAPARTTSFTYNANGQLVSKIDARGAATSFSYYPATTASVTLGDLSAITPPKGLGSSFSAYNKNGFVLNASDSNGLATALTYDALNRVKSVAVGNLTVSYQYDDKGRMVGMNGASGEQATLVYDDADRLIRVTDKFGNVIKYILDPASNTVREEYVDPSGTLRRWLERGFDGLNRLSRIKGAQ